VNYSWDIPVTLGWEAAGYRHDQTELKAGEEPIFHMLATHP